jgi:carboxylesterase type B
MTAATTCVGFGCAALNLTVGSIRGNAWWDGQEFLAIPYATASRFSPPVLSSHLGNFDATNILGDGHDACLQPPYTDLTTSYGTEDCLILNLCE